MIVMVTTGWGVMIMSTPCLDFYFREPHAMDLRNSNTPKFAFAITILSFSWFGNFSSGIGLGLKGN